MREFQIENKMTKSDKFLRLGACATAGAILAMTTGAAGAIMDISSITNIALPIGVAAWGIAIGAIMKHFAESEKEHIIIYPETKEYQNIQEKVNQLREQAQPISLIVKPKLG